MFSDDMKKFSMTHLWRNTNLTTRKSDLQNLDVGASGGIINFISKTGGSEFEGTGKLSSGDYGLFRTDLNLGGPINERLRYNIGGFYRYDEGIRSPGFPANRGGQIKANLTSLREKGYVRAYYKHLDDRNLFLLPIPLKNPDDPEEIPGFDANYGTYASLKE